MEQGRREEDTKQDQHHRRLKPEDQPQHQQPQQHQKCPRCESLNTKFCYYNNYSLSQPRYFCKTCRRYWTQGGTLRNVPVGGGCRKGKRPKASSSGGDDSTSQPPAPPPPAAMMSSTSPASRNKEVGNLVLPSAVPAINSYYSGGGFLSSLAAMQSLNNPPQPFHQQPLHVGGQFGGASNLALLQGFSTVPSYTSARQQIQHQNDQFYQMGNRDKNLEPFYPSDQSLIQPNRPVGSWNQGMVTNTNPQASNPNFWSTTTSISASSNTPAGASLNPNQWPDLPGYDPPT